LWPNICFLSRTPASVVWGFLAFAVSWFVVYLHSMVITGFLWLASSRSNQSYREFRHSKYQFGSGGALAPSSPWGLINSVRDVSPDVDSLGICRVWSRSSFRGLLEAKGVTGESSVRCAVVVRHLFSSMRAARGAWNHSKVSAAKHWATKFLLEQGWHLDNGDGG
jgi:hypothetical protein